MPSSNYSTTKRIKISLSNISLPWLVITLVIFVCLIKLGLWQSSRAVEKEHRLERMVELKQQDSLSLPQVLALKSSNNQIDYLNDFPVVINGSFIPGIIFLLDNQTNKNSLGYRVYQVVNVGEHAVLVNLGWIQGSINRQDLPDVEALVGQFEFSGHIRFIEKGFMLMEQKFESNQWPLRIQQIELEKFSTLIGIKLLPFVVYLDKNEGLGFEKNWQPIVMPPEKHRAYAFQWFSLAVAWLLLMSWASYRFGREDHDKSDNINEK
ncbi:MAG: SURF1 family protein [Colwellia sp.]|nr:SURF1 family protein [Colwellia sp.]